MSDNRILKTKKEGLVSTREAAEIAGVNMDTIRRWDKNGFIKSYRKDRGHRKYCLESLYAYIGQPKAGSLEKQTVIYARVSVEKGEDELNKQVVLMEDICKSNGWEYSVITDIGSGLDFKKPGLLELIGRIETNRVDRIVIKNIDTVLSFGFELICEMCKWRNIDVFIAYEDELESDSTELVADVSILAHELSNRIREFEIRKINKEQSEQRNNDIDILVNGVFKNGSYID